VVTTVPKCGRVHLNLEASQTRDYRRKFGPLAHPITPKAGATPVRGSPRSFASQKRSLRMTSFLQCAEMGMAEEEKVGGVDYGTVGTCKDQEYMGPSLRSG